LKRADILVTDVSIDPNAREILESQVGELMIADDEPAQQES
jgi:hypothetical protein